jgi:hypothetical protein
MWFKHFGSGPGGAGEAYHLGVFGKTGSGKSGLAKMLMLAYARHPQLGILIIDPAGEFSLELTGTEVGEQHLPVQPTLRRLNRATRVLRIRDLQLDEWDLLADLICALRFTEQLGIPAGSTDNARRCADVIREALEGHIRLDALNSDDALRRALTALTNQQKAQYVYSTPLRANQLINYVNDVLQNRFQAVKQRWAPLAQLFGGGDNRRTIMQIVGDLVGANQQSAPRAIISVDLSERGNPGQWSEELQKRLIKKLLDALIVFGTGRLGSGQNTNVLVILDEAARHAPAGSLALPGRRESSESVGCSSARRLAVSTATSSNKRGFSSSALVSRSATSSEDWGSSLAATNGQWSSTNPFEIRTAHRDRTLGSFRSWQSVRCRRWRSAVARCFSQPSLTRRSSWALTD